MLLNIKQVSERLGYRSRSVVQRLVRDGMLDAYLRGTRGRAILLEWAPPDLPDLRTAVQGMVTVRVGSPLLKKAPRSDQRWALLAEIGNDMLRLRQWGAPPWSGPQWATLMGVVELVRLEIEERETTIY